MAHRGSRGIALLFLDHGTRRYEGSASRPGRSLPPGKKRYPLDRGLLKIMGHSEGWKARLRKCTSFLEREAEPVPLCFIL